MNLNLMNDLLDIKVVNTSSIVISIADVAAASISIVITFLLIRAVHSALDIYAERRHDVDMSVVYSVKRIVHYVLSVIGLIVALSLLGFNLDNLAIVAGALGVGIGFGMQNVVNNFVSGIIMLFERSLKVGDFVELVSGLRGEVIAIRIRSTVVRTPDNIEVIIPNSDFVSGQVTNWTLSSAVCRLRIPFGVAYGSDKALVERLVLEVVNGNEFTLPEAPGHATNVWMTGFGESSLDFVLGVWVRRDAVWRQSDAVSSYLKAIDDVFRANHIEVPFPQRDLHLRSGSTVFNKELAD